MLQIRRLNFYKNKEVNYENTKKRLTMLTSIYVTNIFILIFNWVIGYILDKKLDEIKKEIKSLKQGGDK